MGFGSYIEFCHSKQTAPRGRVMCALVALRFRIDRNRGNVLNQMHLLNLKPASFKNADVRAFLERVRFVLTNIRADEMPDRKFMYDWLFHYLQGLRSDQEQGRENPRVT